MSTADDIRREAIERIARSEHQHLNKFRPEPRDWDAVSEGERDEWRYLGSRQVDALGDLLPTEARWAVAGTEDSGDDWIDCESEYGSPYTREEAEQQLQRHYRDTGHLEVQHVTAWTADPTPATESENEQ